MTPPVLAVTELCWGIDDASVLQGVSLDVRPGELVAVMGRNGAGKSTLLDLVAGLRRPTGGSVSIRGAPLDDMGPGERARSLSHLPQSLRANRTVDAEALVLMGRYPHHASRWFESDEDRDVAHAAMRRCDCFDFRARPVGSLSGGERQRVFLAATLAQQASLLLLDEPATYLDVDQQLRCFAVLKQEAEDGRCCLAVTHDINLALTFCTRLIVLHDGRIAVDEPVERALRSPEWLRLFSERLHVEGGAAGRSWVSYR